MLDKLAKFPLLEKTTEKSVDALCRLLRKMYVGKNEGNKNILVVSMHRLGDTVFTIPSLRLLVEKYGNDVIVACFSECVSIYKLEFSNLRYIRVSGNDLKLKGRIASFDIRQKVKAVKPKIIFDITAAINSVTLIAGIRVESLYGISVKYFKNLYNYSVAERTLPHLIDRYFDAVRVAFPEASVEMYREFPVKIQEKGKILIHPFAGWKAKEWGEERFLKLTEELSRDYDVAMIAEKGKLKPESIEYLRGKKLELYETGNLDELIETIKKSIFYIGNDSGPLYIAALLGIPTFAIYSSSNPVYSLPYAPNHSYIIKKLDCSAKENEKICSARGGESGCDFYRCVSELEYAEVYKKIADVIKRLKFVKKNP